MKIEASKGLGPSLAILVAVGGSSPATAHHSSAAFDDKAEVTLAGVVTKFEWANPHVYVFLDVVDETSGRHSVWEIEGAPPAILRRTGWTATTLAAGERVTIVAHPARNKNRRAGLLRSVTRADGTVLDRDSAGEALSERGTPASGKADGLSGTWVTLVGEQSGRFFDEDSLQDEAVYPLTAKAKAAVTSFKEEAELPGLECIPYTAPWVMMIPDTKAVAAAEGTLSIRAEFDDVERVVHLNVASHDGAAASLQGHSIGRWEGNTLVVDTAVFAAHRSGIAWSVPSSSGKHLSERFELDADGRGLTYRFELVDPEYLAKPLTGEAQWVYRPDLVYDAQPCDLANARRFAGN